MNHKERIEYLESLDRETLSPMEVAKVLGGSSYAYNICAKEGKLTLPYIWRGRNLRIFRQPILDLLKGNQNESELSIDLNEPCP